MRTRQRKNLLSYALCATFLLAFSALALRWTAITQAQTTTPLVVMRSEPGTQLDLEHDHSNHTHDGTRFTTTDGVWPPVPEDTENVEWLTPQVSRASRAEAAMAAEAWQLVGESAEIETLLGNRYATNEIAASYEKGNDTPVSHTITWYSYSNNTTITARVENGTVTDIQTIAADVYQPPLTVEEIDEAIIIARQFWLDQGATRINDLEGFGLLGYENAGESGFLDTRMLYISFHVNNDTAPEYLTWVDLTNQIVTDSWEE